MTEYKLPEWMPEWATHDDLGGRVPSQVRQAISQAYAAGREAMRQECADHVFSMAQWDENNEQWVVLHRASTAIRNLK